MVENKLHNLEAPLIDVRSPRKGSTAWCAIAFEELAQAIDLIECGINEMTQDQQQVWKRYKAQTVQFAHDMLLAEGNRSEIQRRLGLVDRNS
ncbi:Uncharacterised protein [Pseudomonas luteola]|uniref:Uncharacterized protein n=2 Tax=Pseudomonas TaxID=286 RepID=A0A2X2CDT4_PSELU|nr:hypothetical protein SAMN05216409_1147 [Pseudomonas lutea]SPZ04891.1 Uncharacterised protein [Pseudomonas luteola]